MSKRLLVFTADSHLAKCAWRRHPEVSGDAYRGFAAGVTYCVNNAAQVAGLGQGGDLFDGAPTAADVELFLARTEELKAAGVPLMLVQGNHAKSATVPWGCVNRYAVWLHGLPPQKLP